MKTNTNNVIAILVVAASLITAGTARAEDTKSEPKKDSYPLTTCVVSGGKLGGDMGEPVKFDYNGREVRFCCPGCVAIFKKDPAKYLKILDDAAAKQSAEAVKSAETTKDNAGQNSAPPAKACH